MMSRGREERMLQTHLPRLGRGCLFGLGAFINTSVGCLATVVGVIFWLSVLITILGVWGGLIWGALWLFFGLPITFLVVSLLTFPLRLFGAFLMYLGRDE